MCATLFCLERAEGEGPYWRVKATHLKSGECKSVSPESAVFTWIKACLSGTIHWVAFGAPIFIMSFFHCWWIMGLMLQENRRGWWPSTHWKVVSWVAEWCSGHISPDSGVFFFNNLSDNLISVFAWRRKLYCRFRDSALTFLDPGQQESVKWKYAKNKAHRAW